MFARRNVPELARAYDSQPLGVFAQLENLFVAGYEYCRICVECRADQEPIVAMYKLRFGKLRGFSST
jgi:hypothetical protein